MRSLPDDRTARAVIRDEALRLFAERGPDAVTIRQIATAAGVSPGLVVHHFGSKEALRRAVDEHVGQVFDALFAEMDGGDWTSTAAAGSLAEAFVAQLPPDSPVLAYLRRLLLAADPAGGRLFRRWYRASETLMAGLVGAGTVMPSDDEPVRTAFLTVNDLALLLLRDQLKDVLGIDPLSRDGMARWAAQALAVYRDGLFTEGAPPGAEHPIPKESS